MIFMKRLICICIAVVFCFALASCGKKTVKETLNYEQPVVSLVGAVNYCDEGSFFGCCLPQEKKEYTSAEGYDKSFLEDLSAAVRNDGESKLTAKVTDSSDVTDEEIGTLESEYNNKHSCHVSFTKALRLKVKFILGGLETENIGTKELYVVRYENIWYIYNEVTELIKFFETA